MPSFPGTIRFPLLFFAFAMLLVALWAGLLRLGWQLPPLRSDGAAVHGALMVSGFLGTLIGLERAVAAAGFAEKPWLKMLPYSAPFLTGMGSIILLAGLPKPGVLLILLGSLILVDLFVYFICKHIALYTVIMGLGTVAWLIGNFLWLQDKPLYRAVPWWIAFLILTIGGERLELSRVMRLSSKAQRFFKLAAAIFLTGVVLTGFNWDIGMRVIGLGEVALAAWLLYYDIAHRTIRQRELPRFIAACLLTGYIWLGIGGLLAICFGGVKAGLHYDAFLHSVFLGFVFSMIFAHAPIILPSITGLSVTYHPRFYLHLILLHLSLLLRTGGDLGLGLPARRWGGLLNVVVLLIFLGSTMYAILSSHGSFQFNLKRSPATTLAFLFPLPAFGLGVALVGIGLLAKPDVSSIASNPAELATAAQQAGYNPTFVSRGQALFRTNCSSCHGLDAKGIPGVGKNLANSEFVNDLSDEALQEFIIRGRSLWDPNNTTGIEMPPRGGNPALSDDDIDHIIAYLRFITAQSR